MIAQRDPNPSPPPAELARCDGVSKAFGQGAVPVEVLRPTDLSVRAGELVLVMGPSGSGKTTLLSLLGCLLRPTRGRLQVGGVEVGPLNEVGLAALRRRHVSFVFQGFNLLSALNARENVALSLRLSGLGPRVAARLAEGRLAQVGLQGFGDHLPAQLSGGQKQRVAVARALAARGRLLLADEPTAALDRENGERVLGLLREASREGRGVVVVTHDSRWVRYADRVVEIEDGAARELPADRPRARRRRRARAARQPSGGTP